MVSTRSKGTNQWNFIWKKTLTRELSLVFPVWWCFSFFFQSGFSRNIFSIFSCSTDLRIRTFHCLQTISSSISLQLSTLWFFIHDHNSYLHFFLFWAFLSCIFVTNQPGLTNGYKRFPRQVSNHMLFPSVKEVLQLFFPVLYYLVYKRWPPRH